MVATNIAFVSSLAALTLAATGCMDDPDLGTEAQAVWNGDGEWCPKLGCSSNSAYLGPVEFHELDETGVEANKEGFRITSFTKNGVSYKLDVTGTTIVGKQFFIGWGWITTLTDQDLVGAEMAIESDDGTLYTIKIFSASTAQKFWQGPVGYVNTYELKWRRVYPSASHYVPVCKDPPSRWDGEGKEWMAVTEAIVFTGDQYDTDTLEVTNIGARATHPWFNIGCAGTVLAKLALNRHTDATATPSIPTTKEQRQAMLKMYTSDVCGTGDAFTVQGTPIRWWSMPGLSSPPIVVNSMEARWNEDGAMCLSTHRLNGTPDDMDSQIQAACAAVNKVIPPCGPNPPAWYLRTATPALP